MHKQIFEILYYLYSNEVIMMTDYLRLTNRYKVSFRILQKSEEEIDAEFIHFITRLENKGLNVDRNLPPIKKFLVHLNNGMDIYQAMTKGLRLSDNQDNRNFVYHVWLFGHYSKYITRLYEVPIKLNPKEEDFQKARGQEVPPSEKYCPISLDDHHDEKTMGLLMAGLRDYENKDELMQKLNINEAYYYDLLAKVMSKEQQSAFRVLTE